ncbi:RES family NAD+ phosphorylase [Azospirillum sp.]|uniref:RES family NAD+ phosphorylase n=1 Tax=Azospirillum sp. TaxID=34012 RepID=UPI002D5D05BD|nr:RES family NAD+ phosphorylase [Azospirillum sp.]HYD65780.1 RES family NAD+ phosphorylase [Azospirillum sp.]
MRVWRIARRPYADLQGIGGEMGDGRWHTRPRRVVYLGSSLALSSLEVLVNLDLPPEFLPRDYVAMEVDLPDDLPVTDVDPAQLPAGWREKAQWPACQGIGNRWLDGRDGALLRAPSAVIPLEHNILLNPAHPDAARARVVATHPFSFDPRVLALLGAAFREPP